MKENLRQSVKLVSLWKNHRMHCRASMEIEAGISQAGNATKTESQDALPCVIKETMMRMV